MLPHKNVGGGISITLVYAEARQIFSKASGDKKPILSTLSIGFFKLKFA